MGPVCQPTAPLRSASVGVPFRDVLEKQHMGVLAGIQTLGSRSYSLLSSVPLLTKNLMARNDCRIG